MGGQVPRRFPGCEKESPFSATSVSSATTEQPRTRRTRQIVWSSRGTAGSAELTPLTERPGKDVRAMAVSESGKPGLISRISRFFKEVRSELRKVAWPNRKELTSYTILVLVTVAVVAVYIGVIDFVVRVALGLILG
jgi:preprotein translocase subunit SecE